MTISILIMRVGLHFSSDKLDQISVDFKAKRVSTLRLKTLKCKNVLKRPIDSGVARITGQGGPKNIRGGQLKQDEN